MQSKISLFNKNIYLKNLTRFWPFALIYFLCLMLMHPLVIYTESLDSYARGFTLSSITFEHFSESTEPITVFLASMVIAIAVFSYLYQSRSANMMHAFPVSRDQLFVSNYLSGLTLLILTQLLTALSVNLILLGKANDAIWTVWAWFGITVAETIFFYSFAVFMVMFTGQLLAAGIFYMIWNFLYVTVVGLIDGCASLFLYGLDENLITLTEHPLFPVAYLMKYVGFRVNDASTYAKVYGINVVAAYVFAGLVFAVLAWFIYKKRRIECAGDFLSMKWTAPIFRWGVVIVGSGACSLYVTYLFNDNDTFITFVISLILFGVLFFFASEMFIEKSFRVFRKKLLVECIACVAVLFVACVLLRLDVFGVEKYVPEEKKVSQVTIMWDANMVSYEDEEHIGDVCRLHQMVVDNIDEIREYDTNDSESFFSYVTIDYMLEDLSTVSRSYAIYTDDEGLKNKMNASLTALVCDVDGNLQSLLGLNYQELNWKLSYVNLSIPKMDETGEWYYGELADVTAEKDKQLLYDAWLADLEAGAFIDTQAEDYDTEVYFQFETNADIAQVRYAKGSSMYYRSLYGAESNLCESKNVYLNSSCTNLFNALKEIGVITDESQLRIPAEAER